MARLNRNNDLLLEFLGKSVPSIQGWATSSDREDEEGMKFHLVKELEWKWSAENDLFEAGLPMLGSGMAEISSKSNRKVQRWIDRDLFVTRYIVERFLGQIKEYRRVATRYEKRARNYLSTVVLTVTSYLLREMAKLVN